MYPASTGWLSYTPSCLHCLKVLLLVYCIVLMWGYKACNTMIYDSRTLDEHNSGFEVHDMWYLCTDYMYANHSVSSIEANAGTTITVWKGHGMQSPALDEFTTRYHCTKRSRYAVPASSWVYYTLWSRLPMLFQPHTQIVLRCVSWCWCGR